ncbi:hypothetical protein GN244_ATG15530 [Phytophthora infestans]|uniref:RxLR effector PexRD54 WY domain-containing protein n=1 Tax=Phytophthora infestans TaxID=4787 RepID=A0A833W7G4_PHYIN|nr:hypothetical protein GN244_ATG15530 [Phytophthora infestans]
MKYADDFSRAQYNREIVFPTLSYCYGDEALSKLIMAAKKNPRAQSFATKLHARQPDHWLNKAGDNLFDNPHFTEWLHYADDYIWRWPTEGKSRILILTSHYGDEALSKLLLEAKKTPSTASTATKLREEQVQHWLDTGTSPQAIIKFLTFDKADEKVWDSSQLKTWLTYVDDYNAKVLGKTVPSIYYMTKYYGEKALTKPLLEAMKISEKTNIAAKLHAEQLHHWLTTRKPPQDVLNVLSLYTAGERLRTSKCGLN